MKTFIYTYSEGRSPKDGSGTKKTVSIWRVVRNKPELIGERTEAFVSEFELVMNCLEEHKALPKKAFERREPSNARVFKSAYALREAGIADLHSL